jgi:hypothetical protein
MVLNKPLGHGSQDLINIFKKWDIREGLLEKNLYIKI